MTWPLWLRIISAMRVRHLFILCSFASIFSISAVFAEPELRLSAEPLSLEQTQDIALRENRDVQRANLEVSKTEAALKSVIASRFPQLSVLALAGQQANSPHVINRAILPNVLQPITQQFRLDLQCREADYAVKNARQQLRLTRQRVVAEVKRTYLTMVSLQASISTREQNLAFLQTLEKFTVAAVNHGAALKVDAALIKAKVAHAVFDLEKDRDDIITLSQSLNRLLNRPLNVAFSVKESELKPMPELGEQAAIDRAVAQRPEISQANIAVTTAKLREKIELSRYIPDISFGALSFYSRNLEITLPRNLTTLAFFGTWEPWDWGRRVEASKVAERQMRQGRVALSDLTDKVSVEADNARRALKLVLYEVEAAGLEESSAGENLRVLTKRYQAGSSLMKDVTEAQASYSEAITENVKAKTHYATVRVDWDLAMGNNF